MGRQVRHKAFSHSGHMVDMQFSAIAEGTGITRQAINDMSRKAILKMSVRLYILSEMERAEALGEPVDDERISDSLAKIINHGGISRLNRILSDRFSLTETPDPYHDDTACVLRGLLVDVAV